MQRKYLLIVLAFALISAMALATLPRAKADYPGGVHIYISPHPVPAPGGTGIVVKAYIDSPLAWDDTADGIVGYAMSVRVDPRILQVANARKARPGIEQLPMGGTPVGFLENFLVRCGYTYYDDFEGWVGSKTNWYAPGDLDTVTGTMLDFSEQIEAYGSLGVGAGGGPYPLVEMLFYVNSKVDPSVIDLFGPPRPPLIIENPMYLTVDGTWHEADVVEDGAYIAETPTTMYFDASAGYDPATSPMYTDWHELWPTFCQWWTMESWEDNSGAPDGVLDESDQVDLVQTSGGAPGTVIWGHVVWVNPTPVAGDGKADLIIEVKVPEFPLGMTPILVLMLGIPVVYLWRRKEWSN